MTCIFVMLIFAHCAACLLIVAAKTEGLPEESWMVVYGTCRLAALHAPSRLSMAMHDTGARVRSGITGSVRTPAACAAPADVIHKSKAVQYVYALFISTSHLFCLGYGLASIPGTFVELCVRPLPPASK